MVDCHMWWILDTHFTKRYNFIFRYQFWIPCCSMCVCGVWCMQYTFWWLWNQQWQWTTNVTVSNLYIGLDPGNHIIQCLNAKLICRCVFVQNWNLVLFAFWGCHSFLLFFQFFHCQSCMIGWKWMNDVEFAMLLMDTTNSDQYFEFLTQLITVVCMENPTTPRI